MPVEGTASAQPVRKAGRFSHEAIAVDPVEGVAYLTEDDFGFPSGFFKYVPPVHPADAGQLRDGGQLFMLAVRNDPNAPLADRQRQRVTYQTVWVPIDDPDPDFPRQPDGTPTTTNDDAIHYVAGQGWAQGAAYFSRLEGAVYDNNVIYFCSTQGGGDPESRHLHIPTDRLRQGVGPNLGLPLPLRPPPAALPGTRPRHPRLPRQHHRQPTRNPGDLRGQHRRQLPARTVAAGNYGDLALNRLPNRTNDEFAGSTFSPDGQTLYVNIQASNGMSFAIWGPWERVGV